MQAGFAMVAAGCVRTNNVMNTLLKNLLDACGAALGFYSIGYAFAWGDHSTTEITFIGKEHFFMIGLDFMEESFWLFQLAFCSASATIVAGTLAERCQMVAYLAYSLTLAAFVYPVVVHSIWSPSGFLSANREGGDVLWGVGMIDFAGSAVVHITGGMTALVATMILGPRAGRFRDLRVRLQLSFHSSKYFAISHHYFPCFSPGQGFGNTKRVYGAFTGTANAWSKLRLMFARWVFHHFS